MAGPRAIWATTQWLYPHIVLPSCEKGVGAARQLEGVAKPRSVRAGWPRLGILPTSAWVCQGLYQVRPSTLLKQCLLMLALPLRNMCNDNVPNLQTWLLFKERFQPGSRVHCRTMGSGGPFWTQFPHLYNVCQAMELSCSPRRQGDATLPLLPWLCPESAVRCQVSRNLGGVDATSLCGPSVTCGGAGQGPDWTGISVLLGTRFALANFPR